MATICLTSFGSGTCRAAPPLRDRSMICRVQLNCERCCLLWFQQFLLLKRRQKSGPSVGACGGSARGSATGHEPNCVSHISGHQRPNSSRWHLVIGADAILTRRTSCLMDLIRSASQAQVGILCTHAAGPEYGANDEHCCAYLNLPPVDPLASLMDRSLLMRLGADRL